MTSQIKNTVRLIKTKRIDMLNLLQARADWLAGQRERISEARSIGGHGVHHAPKRDSCKKKS